MEQNNESSSVGLNTDIFIAPSAKDGMIENLNEDKGNNELGGVSGLSLLPDEHGSEGADQGHNAADQRAVYPDLNDTQLHVSSQKSSKTPPQTFPDFPVSNSTPNREKLSGKPDQHGKSKSDKWQQDAEVSLSSELSATAGSMDVLQDTGAENRGLRFEENGEMDGSATDDLTEAACRERRRVEDGKGPCRCLRLRFFMTWAVFFGMVLINAIRTNIGVTVLTILDKDSIRQHKNSTESISHVPNVDWSTMQIGILHSSFFLGYMISHIPAAYLTTRLPSHRMFGLCILLSTSLNLVLPVSISDGTYWLVLSIRFTQGLSEGLLYPACYGILRHWSTPQERGRVGSLVLTGAYLGPAVGFPVAGVITDYMGWQCIYYVSGGLGVLYVFLWMWISEEKPAHHRLISEDELRFIEDMQGSERIDYEDVSIPWLDILTSLPVVSLCLCNFARNWVFVLMLTNEPFYLNMFHFTITENGLCSALPHVVKITASLSSGMLADYLSSKKLMSTTSIRKLLTSGFGLQAVFFALLTVTQDRVMVVILLTLSVGFGGFVVSGWQLNHYDLSARHASVLVGVTSTFGNIASVSVPIIAGALTQEKRLEGWNQLFYLTSGITGMACFSFMIFGSGERQSWATPSESAHVVIKVDRRRRDTDSVSKPPISRSHPPVLDSHMGDPGDDQVTLTTGPVPNYGSHEITASWKAEKDDTGSMDISK